MIRDKARRRAYLVWYGMLRRCYTSHCADFKNYGGRGIKVCRRWHTFSAFYDDMGTPAQGMTLERVANNGHYSPRNCRWATRREQRRNQRRGLATLKVRGRERAIVELAEKHGLRYRTLYMRLFYYGWPVNKALTTRVQRGGAS